MTCSSSRHATTTPRTTPSTRSCSPSRRREQEELNHENTKVRKTRKRPGRLLPVFFVSFVLSCFRDSVFLRAPRARSAEHGQHGPAVLDDRRGPALCVRQAQLGIDAERVVDRGREVLWPDR